MSRSTRISSASRYFVRAWREKAGPYSQDELARLAGLQRMTVSELERGVRTPHPETVRAVARALKVSVDDLRRKPAA